MEEVLKIKVGADISEATAGLKKVAADASTSATDIAKSSTVASNAIEEIVAPITKVANSLKTLPGAVDGTAKAIGTLSQSTAKSARDLTDFGQSIVKATRVKIGNDYVIVSKSVKQLTAEFRGLEKQLSGATGGEVARINKELDRLATIIQRVKGLGKVGFDQFGQRIQIAGKAVQNTSEQLGKLQAVSGRSTQAITNLNRVVQDAPFGLIGIGNNIEPLLSSFQALKRETGSTGKAIGALVSGFAGPAGLLFAISAAVSIGTLAVQKYGSLGKAFDVLTGKTKALTEDQKKYQESQRQTAVNIQEQRIQTQALVSVARGDVGTKEQQAQALKKLNELIPDNIGKLTQQNIAKKEGIRVLAAYVKALEAEATAQLLVGRAAELNVKLFDAERKVKDELRSNLIDQIQLELQLAQLRQKASNLVGSGADLQGAQFAALQTQIINLKNTYKASVKSFVSDSKAIKKELNDVLGEIQSNTAEAVTLEFKDPATGKSKDFLKDRIASLETLKKEIGLLRIEEIELTNLKIKLNIRDAVKNGLDQGEVARINAGLEEELEIKLTAKVDISSSLKEQSASLAKSIKAINTAAALPKATAGAANLDILTNGVANLFVALRDQTPLQRLRSSIADTVRLIDLYRTKLETTGDSKIRTQLDELTKSLANQRVEMFQLSGIVEVLGGFFQSTFEAALISGQNFFQSLIKGLKQLIGRLIAAAATAAILAAILNGGFGAGFLGKFTESFKGLSGGLDLGGLFKGSAAPGIGRSPQAPGVAAMGNQGGEVVFRIAGQELLGVINRTNKANAYNG